MRYVYPPHHLQMILPYLRHILPQNVHEYLLQIWYQREIRIQSFQSGIVTFGESKLQHFESMKNREWLLGDTIVDELYEYKNLGVLKNYVRSFSSMSKIISLKPAKMLA